MNIGSLKSTAISLGRRALLQGRKYSPEILVVAGVVGVVGSVVLASKATLKLEDTVEKAQERIDTVREIHEPDNSSPAYTRDLAYAYLRNVGDLVWLYTPSGTLLITSLGAILTAHGILRRRNLALIAAYNTLERTFGNYRKRVAEEFGEEKEYEISHGIQRELVDDPKKEGKKKEVVKAGIASDFSPYARCFEKGSTPNWHVEPSYNLAWIRSQEEYANEMLRIRGHVFLNDVYDGLGFPRTREGSVVGWVINDKNGPGDNYISFGIYDLERKEVRNFLNGAENAIWLDFNVDGVIYDKI